MKRLVFSAMVGLVGTTAASAARAGDADLFVNSGFLFDHSFGGQGNGYGLEVSIMRFPNGLWADWPLGYGAFAQAQATSRGAGRFAGGFQFGTILGAELGGFYQTATSSDLRSYGIHAGLYLMMYALIGVRLDIPVSRGPSDSFQPVDAALTLGLKIPWDVVHGGVGPQWSGIPMR